MMEIGAQTSAGFALGVASGDNQLSAATQSMAANVMLAPPPMSRGGGTINVTINAGLGTDPRELGRVVVDAIRTHERVAGKVFAAA
jgi:hypothetical protein